jgi:hypothetical protein
LQNQGDALEREHTRRAFNHEFRRGSLIHNVSCTVSKLQAPATFRPPLLAVTLPDLRGCTFRLSDGLQCTVREAGISLSAVKCNASQAQAFVIAIRIFDQRDAKVDRQVTKMIHLSKI